MTYEETKDKAVRQTRKDTPNSIIRAWLEHCEALSYDKDYATINMETTVGRIINKR
jgi:hypothetical protein